MGAGSAGNFGKTKGSVDLKSFLDTLSGLLAIASLIPVADTAIDIAALLVDLLRGDYVSAALDLAGVIPFVGEVADTARIAKVTDKTIDAVKTAKKVDKAVDTAKATKKISKGKKITNSITKVKRVGKATKLVDVITDKDKIYDEYFAGIMKKYNKTNNLFTCFNVSLITSIFPFPSDI